MSKRDEIKKLEADIIKMWIGSTVKHNGYSKYSGKLATITEAMFDEQGRCHCRDVEGFWTPAYMLEFDATPAQETPEAVDATMSKFKTSPAYFPGTPSLPYD
ncbi:hypothetical protein A3F38_00605 [Candidatus Saccharibacteria bacterium RIFCSPHIGHO2_12_FULL_48_21]|nr:MAG: hypothetical protein A3F38_00605 [Candidatus Saccharibacteria bacterium RIFCSPHIGHO2_12_FULL_48_21]